MSLLTRIERLEMRRPAKSIDYRASVAALQARLEACWREREAYGRMSIVERIAHQEQRLEGLKAEDPATMGSFEARWHTLRCRLTQISLEELQGASPELIEAARDEANENFRGNARSYREADPGATAAVPDIPDIPDIRPPERAKRISRVMGQPAEGFKFSGYAERELEPDQP
jgi:hypothetical protein